MLSFSFLRRRQERCACVVECMLECCASVSFCHDYVVVVFVVQSRGCVAVSRWMRLSACASASVCRASAAAALLRPSSSFLPWIPLADVVWSQRRSHGAVAGEAASRPRRQIATNDETFGASAKRAGDDGDGTQRPHPRPPLRHATATREPRGTNIWREESRQATNTSHRTHQSSRRRCGNITVIGQHKRSASRKKNALKQRTQATRSINALDKCARAPVKGTPPTPSWPYVAAHWHRLPGT